MRYFYLNKPWLKQLRLLNQAECKMINSSLAADRWHQHWAAPSNNKKETTKGTKISSRVLMAPRPSTSLIQGSHKGHQQLRHILETESDFWSCPSFCLSTANQRPTGHAPKCAWRWSPGFITRVRSLVLVPIRFSRPHPILLMQKRISKIASVYQQIIG